METKTIKRPRNEIIIDRIKVRAEITSRECEKSFYKFLQYFWDTIIPEPLILNWHMKILCDELQEVGERLIKREPSPYDLLINVPPGTTKSTICTIMFPAWLWLKDATIRTISGSYSAELAVDHSVKSRRILKSDKFIELYGDLIEFSKDQDNKTNYENTKGGSRSACGVGGTILGKHGHLLLIDDPINPKQSTSEQMRKVANEWMKNTLSTRKVDKKVSATIIIMQRLHEEDPAGVRLQKGNLRHICLPAEMTDLDNVRPKEYEKYYKGKLLDPVRMDEGVLAWEKEEKGSIEYAGQFLQSPMAAEGNIIKRKWFNLYEVLPATKPQRIVHSWDTAFKEKEQNDFNSCTTWYEYPNGFYLAHCLNEKLNYPKLKRKFLQHCKDWNPNVILIPDTDAGQALIMEMREQSKHPITAIQVDRDKISNAASASPLMEAGKVYIPKNENWIESFLTQLCGFPNVKNDDIVDTVTQFLNWVRENPFGSPRGTSRRQRETDKILRGYS